MRESNDWQMNRVWVKAVLGCGKSNDQRWTQRLGSYLVAYTYSQISSGVRLWSSNYQALAGANSQHVLKMCSLQRHGSHDLQLFSTWVQLPSLLAQTWPATEQTRTAQSHLVKKWHMFTMSGSGGSEPVPETSAASTWAFRGTRRERLTRWVWGQLKSCHSGTIKLGEAGQSNFIDSFSVMQTDERMKKTAACRLQHQARGLRGVLIPLNPVRLERPPPQESAGDTKRASHPIPWWPQNFKSTSDSKLDVNDWNLPLKLKWDLSD